MVPSQVELIYRVVGDTHVFSSKGIRGLVHVGSHDQEEAFREVINALNKHITITYDCEAKYKCETSFNDFCKHLEMANDIPGNFLTMTLERSAQNCH